MPVGNRIWRMNSSKKKQKQWKEYSSFHHFTPSTGHVTNTTFENCELQSFASSRKRSLANGIGIGNSPGKGVQWRLSSCFQMFQSRYDWHWHSVNLSNDYSYY
jgi:hypothetical protein